MRGIVLLDVFVNIRLRLPNRPANRWTPATEGVYATHLFN